MSRLTKCLVPVVAGLLLAGCASMGDSVIHVGDSEKPNPNALKFKYQASIRMAGYLDARPAAEPRRIGRREVRVIGMSGPDVMVDRDVSDIVGVSLRKRLDDFGIQMLAKDDPSALFELNGVIKELRYDIKSRDQIHIKLETTLKEIATGKVVWAGEVEQKDERFAGVSGNSKGDIADYLKKEVGVVTDKTAEAINSVLMATRPDLFNLTPGTKVIPGVKVLVTPGVAAPSQPAVIPSAPAPAANDKPQAGAATGMLVVSSSPDRAKVYVDGVYFGMTPLRVEIEPGVRKVEARMKGYKAASEKVSIRKGDSTELELVLSH